MARAPEPKRLRQIIIQVVDASGEPLSGANIDVRRGATPIGLMISSGRSSIDIKGVEALQVRASVPGANAQAVVGPRQKSVTLTLATTRFVEVASTPTARCPDGTSGQPCVTCIIDGREVRICG